MKIGVLIKQVPDTYGERRLDPGTGLVDRDDSDRVVDEIDERALEVALRRKDADKSTEVVVISMGPAGATEALRKGLSMGADAAVHVLDDGLRGADAVRTSEVLAAVVERGGYDLVLAGNESTDGRGGVVPAMIAERLRRALLVGLDEAEIADGGVSGSRTSGLGTLRAHVALPAVVSITERAAEARFPNFKGIMTAKRKPMEVLSVADLGLAAVGARTVVLETTERPARSAGRKIVDQGDAAVELAEFLAAGRLI